MLLPLFKKIDNEERAKGCEQSVAAFEKIAKEERAEGCHL